MGKKKKKKNCDMACSIKNNAHDIQFNNMAGIFFSNQPEQHKISEGKKKYLQKPGEEKGSSSKCLHAWHSPQPLAPGSAKSDRR